MVLVLKQYKPHCHCHAVSSIKVVVAIVIFKIRSNNSTKAQIIFECQQTSVYNI